MIKKCLLDADGIIVDFNRGACELFNKHPSTATRWNFWNDWGMTDQEFWSHLGEEFWANLPFTVEGEWIADMVIKKFGVNNVCILTSPCSTHGCVEGKIRWIKKNLPQLRRQFLVGPRKEFCARPDHLLIDDYEENTEAFSLRGGQTFLFPRPWNNRREEVNNGLNLLKEFLDNV